MDNSARWSSIPNLVTVWFAFPLFVHHSLEVTVTMACPIRALIFKYILLCFTWLSHDILNVSWFNQLRLYHNSYYFKLYYFYALWVQNIYIKFCYNILKFYVVPAAIKITPIANLLAKMWTILRTYSLNWVFSHMTWPSSLQSKTLVIPTTEQDQVIHTPEEDTCTHYWARRV